jgi:hypothetical protein
MYMVVCFLGYAHSPGRVSEHVKKSAELAEWQPMMKYFYINNEGIVAPLYVWLALLS